MALSQTSKNDLLVKLKSLRLQERECVTEILKYLAEVERRKLYLEEGFSSLYVFCTNELGYSEDEAYIRIQAMRCMKEIPEVQNKIETGRISLTVVAKAQKVIRQQRKNNQPLSLGQKTELLESLSGVSVREADKKKLLLCFQKQLPHVRK